MAVIGCHSLVVRGSCVANSDWHRARIENLWSLQLEASNIIRVIQKQNTVDVGKRENLAGEQVKHNKPRVEMKAANVNINWGA